MAEIISAAATTISQDLLLARISRHEDMRLFFMSMYEQNPHLLRTAGKRVNDMLTPLNELQKNSELADFARYVK